MMKNCCFGNTCNKKIISRDNQHPHSTFVAMHGSRAGIQIGSKSGTDTALDILTSGPDASKSGSAKSPRSQWRTELALGTEKVILPDLWAYLLHIK
jgi:hypothetical protein